MNVDGPSGLRIYDLQGKIMYQTYIASGTNTIDIGHLTKGSYILVVIDEQGTIHKEKLIIGP